MSIPRTQDLAAAFQEVGADKALLSKGVASAQRAAGVTPMDFGAIGDGVADDTTAVLAAMQYAGTVDWLDKTYRITSEVAATLAGPAVWHARGAIIRLDSAASARRAVSVDVAGNMLAIEGPRLEIDGNAKAFTGIYIHNETDPRNPDLIATGLVATNMYRASTAFAGGDGIYIAGGFRKVTLIRPEAKECFMAVGAGVAGSQGIFGITVAILSGRHARHVKIQGPLVRNIWSEDPAWLNDQDGIRVFQVMSDSQSTCLIEDYTCENASNRAVKLHSVPNGKVRKVYRVLDASVVPQNANLSNPDFDAQQAPAEFSDIEFYYKGRCHEEVIRTITDPGDNRYGGAQVSGIDGRIEDLPGNTIRLLGAVSSADGTTPFPDSAHRMAINNVTIIGPIARIATINLRGSGKNILTGSNIVADVTEAAFVASGSSTAALIALVSNIANAGASVPLTSGFTGSRTITAAGTHGFT